MTLVQRLLFATLLAFAGPALSAPTAQPLKKVTFCIYDPLGTRGDAFSIAQDHALVARQWGVDMKLRPYVDERVAADDFKAGHCDGVAITTVRARQFNAFVGSIDSIGAVPTVQHMRLLEQALASPKLAPRMVHENFEVVGVVPMGAAYVLVTDRRIDSVDKAAGKKIAVLELDKAQAKIVERLGAQAVATDLTNFAGKFNNHQVDVLVAPVVLYQPMELYKGVGTQGAIYRFPLGQLSATLLIRREKFPPGFGQKSREHVLTQMDKAFAVATRAEKDIPASQWLSLSPADEARYHKMMREARIQLMNEGIYDRSMMRLLKNIRCRVDPGNAECALTDE